MKNLHVKHLPLRQFWHQFYSDLLLKLLLFSFFLFHTFDLLAFNAILFSKQVNLRVKNATLKEVLLEIKKQTDCSFLYNNEDVNDETRSSVEVINQPLQNVLDEMLKKQGLDYELKEDNVILIYKPSSSNTQSAGTRTVQQLRKINGVIVDEANIPIAGASIIRKGTSNGTISDTNGNFLLDVSDGAILSISYIGFLSQEVVVGEKTFLNIVLREDLKALDEVVVVGFAKQKKANLTGAVSSVKIDDLLKERPVINTASLLQGAIPGLQVTSSTGEPGGGYTFNVRGGTGMKWDSDRKQYVVSTGEPLILVDNAPLTGPMSLINPADIESVTVLKDGGAAAIYGARGAFGVVLITTKGGKKDQKTKVNYSGNVSFTNASQLPQKSSPMQTVQSFKDFGYTGSTAWRGRDTDVWLEYLCQYKETPSLFSDGYVYGNDGNLYQLKEYDMMKDFIGNTGFQHTHNVSVSGGSPKTSYRISMGYVDSDGVMVTNKDRYKKFSIKSFVDTEITSWLSGQLDINYYRSEKTMPNNGGWSLAVAVPSFIPTGTWEVNGEELMLGTPGNLVRMSALDKDDYSDTRISGRLIASPLKDWTITGELTYDHLNRETVNYSKKLTYASIYDYDKTIEPSTSAYDNTKRVIKNTVLNLFSTYDKALGNHKFTLMGGFNMEEYHQDYLRVISYDMINDELPSVTQSVGEQKPSDAFSEYALLGFFGRINYTLKDRYLLELNGRYDGSSKFPLGHRWGFFPSVSIGWKITEEPFMKSVRDFMPELKLRGSYATIGNQNIDPYSFVAEMDVAYNWLHDYSRTATLTTPGLVSNSFTWETIETTNVGLDASFFGGRLSASLEYYIRKTKDMLDNGAELPNVIGTGSALQNIANMESKGYEIDLRWRDRIGKVSYNIGFNLYDYKSKITKMPSNITNQIYTSSGYNAYFEGYQLGTIWGYETDRFYTDADFDSAGNLLAGVPYVSGISPKPGDVLYKAFDDDGIIRSAETLDNMRDQKKIGNSSLRFQYGISGGASWNNFDFSFYIQGIAKRDLWLANELTFPSYYEFGSMFNHLTNYWTPETPHAKYPRGYATGTKNNNYNANIRTQTKYLLNGAYMRVKNISLGYSIPKEAVKKVGIERAKINVGVENPFMFSHLPKGVDPTLSAKGRGLGYPVMRVWSLGLSLDF